MSGAGNVGGFLRTAFQLRQDGPDHLKVLKLGCDAGNGDARYSCIDWFTMIYLSYVYVHECVYTYICIYLYTYAYLCVYRDI